MEGIGESFACVDRDVIEEPSVRVNGEVMYMAQGVGLFSRGGEYRPGCRFGMEKLGRGYWGDIYLLGG